jgi:hypothetical protein
LRLPDHIDAMRIGRLDEGPRERIAAGHLEE